ncbi:MAG: NUDIX domain-containing protein [Chloroflexota bacterium]|nr:MAG: NUDIX domain-containing protein [Chloroflexota bacterium]
MIDENWYQKPEGMPESTSAGGVVVRVTGGQVWIALVRDSEHQDYILPKGTVEPGETLETAARREIEEEAGFTDLVLVSKLGAVERLNYTRKKWKTVHYFLFLTRQTESRPTDPNHAYQVDWYPVEQLPAMFWPDQKKLIEDNLDKITNLSTPK